MTGSNCQFEEGDRIDHKLFGFGTVAGAPVAMVGPNAENISGIRDAGWSIRLNGMTQSAPQEQSRIMRYAKCRRQTLGPSPTGIDSGNLCFSLGWQLDEKLSRFPHTSDPCPSRKLWHEFRRLSEEHSKQRSAFGKRSEQGTIHRTGPRLSAGRRLSGS